MTMLPSRGRIGPGPEPPARGPGRCVTRADAARRAYHARNPDGTTPRLDWSDCIDWPNIDEEEQEDWRRVAEAIGEPRKPLISDTAAIGIAAVAGTFLSRLIKPAPTRSAEPVEFPLSCVCAVYACTCGHYRGSHDARYPHACCGHRSDENKCYPCPCEAFAKAAR